MIEYAALVSLLLPTLKELVVESSSDAIQHWLPRASRRLGKQIAAWLNGSQRDPIAALGSMDSASIDRLIADAETVSGKELTVQQRRGLARLLRHAARGAQTMSRMDLTAEGVRMHKSLLIDLLKNLQIARHQGQSVGAGFSDWKLESFVGKGAFGEVWSARCGGSDGMRRAFKFFTSDPSRHWFQREFDHLLKIKEALPSNHPNLVSLIDVSSDQDKPWHPFLGFEFVPGGSLEDWILGVGDSPADLDPSTIISGIIAGLAAAHRARIHHRDLKPANVLLDRDRRGGIRARLTDFGLATAEGPATHSATASIVAAAGTPMYLPPENGLFVAADPAKQDIFALGVVWYQMLVERIEVVPYNFAMLLRDRAVDSGTIALISRCLADPDHRFANAIDLEDAFRDELPPPWTPAEGCFDVQPIFREYAAAINR